jgi:hypothetical protein
MQVIGVPDDLNRELQYGQQQADRVDGERLGECLAAPPVAAGSGFVCYLTRGAGVRCRSSPLSESATHSPRASALV